MLSDEKENTQLRKTFICILNVVSNTSVQTRAQNSHDQHLHRKYLGEHRTACGRVSQLCDAR